MRAADIEAVIPGLAEQRARERRNREIAFLALTHTVCGREILPLTPRHRMELQLLGNAFARRGAMAAERDLFVFLWVLDPRNQRRRNWRESCHQWILRRHVKKLEIGQAVAEIRNYLTDQLQDAPSGTTGGESNDQSAWVCGAAMDAGFWIEVHGGFTVESYLATPFLILQQLYRAWLCNHPETITLRSGEVVFAPPQFINESDRLMGQWHKDRRDQIAEIIRAQTTRLP